MPDSDDMARELLETVYRDFNARDIDAILARMTDEVQWPKAWEGGYFQGREEVRDYWSRQWAELDPTVTPVGFASQPDGRVDVTVRQVIRDRAGALLGDSTVHHVYRLQGGQIAHMEIRE